MSPEDSGAQFSMLETCGTLRKLPQSRSAYLCDLLRPALGWPPSSLFLLGPKPFLKSEFKSFTL